jgi:uncharacterized membrane protein
MTKNKRILITILALVGLALSIELCFVYYNANFAVDAKPSICAINAKMDCDGVAKTSYSQFFGVPLALWGVILYLFFLFMTYVDKIKNIKFLGFLNVFKNPISYIFCFSFISFLISICLGGISVFKINSICIFCFMTYFVDLLIAISSKSKGISFIDEFKITISDFIEAIKVKRYAFWFTLIVLLGVSVLAYTTTTNVLTPQSAKQQLFKKSFDSYKLLTDKNQLGPKDADVIIHEYVDFNCGGCFMANLYLHNIVSEFSNVKVIQHNIPLEKVCNHNMQSEGHKNSCLKTRYALAAAKQNMYWQMADILFEQAPENEKEIIEEARLANFDIKKLQDDANSEEIKQELANSIKEADEKSINGTPTLFIGMKRILGVNSYPELRNMVIEQGGKEKQ